MGGAHAVPLQLVEVPVGTSMGPAVGDGAKRGTWSSLVQNCIKSHI